ncbi:hypothetical protein LT980_11775 [Citrobacter portucalensis]|uniref:hypothetical protein n=1 Tax=Citrobacter portucalensis TaxID=1639133 RepID=UPI00202CFDE9|nr:hypothetical protein [Citrobacter portucalensis]URR15207.1 hypothetical protein LT980_11775 [Citrobacter portucalensis]
MDKITNTDNQYRQLMLLFAATTILAGYGSHYDEEKALARSAQTLAAKEQHNIIA